MSDPLDFDWKALAEEMTAHDIFATVGAAKDSIAVLSEKFDPLPDSSLREMLLTWLDHEDHLLDLLGAVTSQWEECRKMLEFVMHDDEEEDR